MKVQLCEIHDNLCQVMLKLGRLYDAEVYDEKYYLIDPEDGGGPLRFDKYNFDIIQEASHIDRSQIAKEVMLIVMTQKTFASPAELADASFDIADAFIKKSKTPINQ